MYCLNMLKIALELSKINPCYEDMASKFFEHFLYISDAINHHEGSGLWDEEDGFYYDRLRMPRDEHKLLRVRSLVGLVPFSPPIRLSSRVSTGIPVSRNACSGSSRTAKI